MTFYIVVVRGSVYVEPKYHVRALARGLQILDAFTPTEETLSLAQLAEKTGFDKATLIRLLTCLEEAGYVERAANDLGYQIGAKAYHLALVYQATHPWPSAAIPVIQRLAQDSGYTSEIGVLDGWSTRTVAVADSNRALRRQTSVGERFPIHCTSMGKILVAYRDAPEIDRIIEAGLPRHTAKTIVDPDAFRAELAAIRARGYAFDDEEWSVGLCCISAPIRDATGQVIAGVNISGPAGEFTESALPRLAAEVVQAAVSISTRLGYGLPGVGSLNATARRSRDVVTAR